VHAAIGYMFSLNLSRKKAYIAEVRYSYSITNDYSNTRHYKRAQALILESKKHLPYIKIAKKPKFWTKWTKLKLFYHPASRDIEEISINETYNLYCAAESARRFLNFSTGVMAPIEKNKLNVEINGKYIVVYKLGYTMDLRKFTVQTLAIAEAFYNKIL
jgi:hypothetical protein